MGQDSRIEWTHDTFNIVWGCQRVSPGCEHCYAETLAERYGYDVWGPAKTTERRTMGLNYWKQPVRWNAQAEQAGERRRVFCGSMCDVFEDHPTNERERWRLWGMIERTPHLDWLLLTKRPENMARMVPPEWMKRGPRNVWYGTSAEDQRRLDERLPHLLAMPAHVRFLSCEPLLGPLDLKLFRIGTTNWGITVPAWMGLNWVIAGGESGHGARPMNPAWVRSLRDQCKATPSDGGTKFFFKQWGEYQYGDKRAQREPDGSVTFHNDGMPLYVRAGKKTAGRILDGRTWDEVPQC